MIPLVGRVFLSVLAVTVGCSHEAKQESQVRVRLDVVRPHAPFDLPASEKKAFLSKLVTIQQGSELNETIAVLGPPYEGYKITPKKSSDTSRGTAVSYFLKKLDANQANEKQDQYICLEFNNDNRLVRIHTNIRGLNFGRLTGHNSGTAQLPSELKGT